MLLCLLSWTVIFGMQEDVQATIIHTKNYSLEAQNCFAIINGNSEGFYRSLAENWQVMRNKCDVYLNQCCVDIRHLTYHLYDYFSDHIKLQQNSTETYEFYVPVITHNLENSCLWNATLASSYYLLYNLVGVFKSGDGSRIVVHNKLKNMQYYGALGERRSCFFSFNRCKFKRCSVHQFLVFTVFSISLNTGFSSISMFPAL